MTERPLLFTGDMIRALLNGSKTQTRRLGTRYAKWRKGDRVWVRETWKALQNDYGADVATCYRASESPEIEGPWKPSIFMPRWASRITLELVADVRRERLQNISGEEARAEGIIYPVMPTDNPTKVKPLFRVPDAMERAKEWGILDAPTHDDMSRLYYSLLWDSINEQPGMRWDDNPEVCVIAFKVAETR